jgi:fibro-slime domain-containing protein
MARLTHMGRLLTAALLTAAFGMAACSASSDGSKEPDGKSGGAGASASGNGGTSGRGGTGGIIGLGGSIQTAGGAGTTVCEPGDTSCHYAVVDPPPTCGDGIINVHDDGTTEDCDDGNPLPGDGCTGACAIEPNYECPTEGEPCVSTIVCGDSIRSTGELCDDGNTTANDGCAADCRSVDAGYFCPTAGELCQPLQNCGDGRIQTGEQCDVVSPGCILCHVTTGYRCTPTGCILLPVCNNSIVEAGENCDDGNLIPGDGCSVTCQREASYWDCPPAGGACISLVSCGDGKVEGTEKCDDGNINNGDGCSSACFISTGYKCPMPGQPCVPDCGDGKKAGSEACDDGNKVGGDGCSTTCLIEPGYVCLTVNAPCTKTVCGNGVVEAGEGCDKGSANGLFYGDGQGCSLTCTTEPTCRDATAINGNYNRACDKKCGDGMKGPGEACDDGNLVAGDGCSPLCVVESGFTCSDYALQATKTCPSGTGQCLILPVIYRDFTATQYCSTDGSGTVNVPVACASQPWANPHPDFYYWQAGINAGWGQGNTILSPGLVNKYLNATGKPVYQSGTDQMSVARPGQKNWRITQDATSFSQWYTDSAFSRMRLATLPMTVSGTSASFNSDNPATVDPDGNDEWGEYMEGHFPLDAYSGVETKVCASWTNGWGYAGVTCTADKLHDFYFTSEVRYVFQFNGGEILEFSGDDDVWVFINGILTVDLGGMHQPRTGRVTLAATPALSSVVTQDGANDRTNYFIRDPANPTQPAPFTAHNVALGLTAGESYEIVVYHADRHPIDSNYHLTLSGFDATRSGCTATCGNGIRTISEECDNGAANNDTLYGGCTTACVYGPRCGDAVTQASAGEQCDDGTNTSVAYGSTACGPGCKLPPRCGDGEQDPGEECDNGAANSNATYGGCSTACKLGARCGDGILQATEACDDGLNIGGYGQCAAGCVLGERCGDGVIQDAAGEGCDDGTDNGKPGFCSATCGQPAYCGDGVKDSTEDCDAGTTLNTGAYGGCNVDCTYGPRCGDGVVDSANNEVCDLGPGNEPVGAVSYGGCTDTCQLGPYCGDGAKQGTEQCDDGNNTSQDGCSGICLNEVIIK